MMHYKRLGDRGPLVSTVGLGCWAIGGTDWGTTDDDVSLAAIHAALDRGVTLLDTADVYGRGHSEELLARVLRERKMSNVVIATKVGNDFYHATESDDRGYGPIRQNYDKDYIITAAERSLRRLGVEVIDILQLHSGDLAQLERDEPWEALEALKRDGKIKHAGWSVQSFQESAQAAILDRHQALIDVIQVRYNILEREAERLLFPKAMQYGTGVIVRIPLLFGLLTGKFTREARFRDDDHRRFNLSAARLDEYLTRLDRLRAAYAELGPQSMAQVSLRFCLSHPACHTVIPGAKTAIQISENLWVADVGPLTEEQRFRFALDDDRFACCSDDG